MHPAAWIAAALFFTHLDVYLPKPPGKHYTVVDLGAYDVNGNMRDALAFSPFSRRNHSYTGVDIAAGPNVDVVLNSSREAWSFLEQPADVIISSSTFEHDKFFWQTFLRMSEALADGGFMLTILPQRIHEHRYPTDNWRFMPDSSEALADWARSNGLGVHVVYNEVVESAGYLTDVVAVYWKAPPGAAPTAPPAYFEELSADIAVNLEQLLIHLPGGFQQQAVTHRGAVLSPAAVRASTGRRVVSSADPVAAKDIVCRRLAWQSMRHLHHLSAEALTIPAENAPLLHIPLPISLTTGNCAVQMTYLVSLEELLFEGKLRVNAAAATARLGLGAASAAEVMATVAAHKEILMQTFSEHEKRQQMAGV